MNDKIIDARSRFRGSEENHKPASNLTANLRKRLESVDQIAERLRRTPRTPELDRPILARNLGRIIEHYREESASVDLAELFRRAFGDRSGDANFKKRKRFIRFKGEGADLLPESINTGNYAAHGKEYVALAEALASFHLRMGPSNSDENRKLHILQLVASSSFDDRRSISERFEEEARTELSLRLDQLVERVTERVELDWMRQWAQRHSVLPIGKLGIMDAVEIGSWDSGGWADQLDILDPIFDENTSESDWACYSRMPPCVRLGYLYAAYKPIGALAFEVERNEIDRLGEYAAVRAALWAKYDFMGSPPDDSTCWPIDLEENESWKADDELNWERPRLWFQRVIDLELRFDRTALRWKPCLAIRSTLLDNSGHFEQLLFYRDESSVSEPFHSLMWLCEQDNGLAIQAVRNYESDAMVMYYAFIESHAGGLIGDYPLELAEKSFGIFPLSSEEGLSFALTGLRLKELRVEYLIENPPGKETPAPADSIAAAILRNLAYAPFQKRLDQLLIVDASQRVKKLRALANQVEGEYKSAIERFAKDDTRPDLD